MTSTMRCASHQLPSIDPRSPINLSIPQHNILTAFQSLSGNSPVTNSTNSFQFKNPTPTPSPVTPSSRLYYESTFPSFGPEPVYETVQAAQGDQVSSSSLKFLLQTGRVPSVMVGCPCGEGRQTTRHILKECKRFEGERDGLMVKSPRSPRTPGTPRSPREKEVMIMHAARKWRMKTLLGRYQMAVQKQDSFAGQGGYGAPLKVGSNQKSPRPDVVELGLVKGAGFGGKIRNAFGR
ncbi:hypothetical protein BJ878DRAFT_516459 [Calycina marina]|uniref:Uncharacterized protein n=1 Tax=Calycina marina TaxID=1763456 RepID=A0A9P8CCS7_9HELO|nr:hypothetical protein BJ878DRAFT_516459 [Calycina marina]